VELQALSNREIRLAHVANAPVEFRVPLLVRCFMVQAFLHRLVRPVVAKREMRSLDILHLFHPSLLRHKVTSLFLLQGLLLGVVRELLVVKLGSDLRAMYFINSLTLSCNRSHHAFVFVRSLRRAVHFLSRKEGLRLRGHPVGLH